MIYKEDGGTCIKLISNQTHESICIATPEKIIIFIGHTVIGRKLNENIRNSNTSFNQREETRIRGMSKTKNIRIKLRHMVILTQFKDAVGNHVDFNHLLSE